MIRATNLSKYYGGKRALGPVSFEIGDGETVGFLGLNGAGKTTALRILACDLRPSSGSIEVGGVDAVADPHEVRKRIGFLPENPPLYVDMTVADYLRFAAELRGMSKAEITKRLPDVLDVTDLTDVASEVIGTLSHGFRQRVGVGQAIVHNPKFLILDEPTRGLDPVQIVEMRTLIHDLKQHHTVLISSHILTEISQTCDRLLVLGKGQLLGSGSEADLVGKESDIREVSVTLRLPKDGDHAAATSVLKAVEGVSAVAAPFEQGGGMTFTLSTSRDCRAEVSRAVVTAKLDLLKLDYARSELENTFIRLVGGTDASN
ncbi:MAG: ABC transporter ATP-binding protein [Myxococcales bacterium]|nr:ABC transporter ATP-binding protein [Myxococcales bacterium]HRC57889.1 ABC transporter ATP-binding protein [Kofleriaceae bacterium]